MRASGTTKTRTLGIMGTPEVVVMVGAQAIGTVGTPGTLEYSKSGNIGNVRNARNAGNFREH